jgi:hypothetical protein
MIGQTTVNIYQFSPLRTREFYCFPITRLQDSIRLFSDRFARRLLKSADRYDVGVSSEAYSGDASLCECT